MKKETRNTKIYCPLKSKEKKGSRELLWWDLDKREKERVKIRNLSFPEGL